MTHRMLKANVQLAKRRVDYWQVREDSTKPGTPEHTHARIMLGQRKAQLAKARADLAAASPTTVNDRGLRFIQRFEGWFSYPYDDGTGVKTIGWGFIASDFPGGRVPDRMSRAQGDRMLRHIIDTRYAPPVVRAIARFHPGQAMTNGCVSFAYNLGVGAFQGAAGFETLTRALRSGSRQDVARAFLLYDNPNDPAVHAGLARRRRAEARLVRLG